MKKTIVTDIDGVVLDWEEGFSIWMEHHGHKKVEGYQFMYKIGDRYGISNNQGHKLIKTFNESAAIGFLPPLRDAQYFIKKLHEQHQYQFIAITSLSLNPYSQKLREKNLKKMFGDNCFLDVICLDTGADKDDALAPYAGSGCVWVEDKPENVDLGITLGLEGILIDHHHNAGYDGAATVVQGWKEIYEMLT